MANPLPTIKLIVLIDNAYIICYLDTIIGKPQICKTQVRQIHSFYIIPQLKTYKSLYKCYKFLTIENLLAKRINDDSFVVLVCLAIGWHFSTFLTKFVFEQVRHSRKMSERHLDAWIILFNDGSVTSAHCKCMAGLGEVLTCTDSTNLLLGQYQLSEMSIW